MGGKQVKALILAAGFGTRMYPLTEKIAKPLLPIGEKKLIDFIVEKVLQIEEVDEIVVVSNNRFFKDFEEWRDSKNFSKKNKNIFTFFILNNQQLVHFELLYNKSHHFPQFY